MKNMKKVITILTLLVHLSGCVGVMIVHNDESTKIHEIEKAKKEDLLTKTILLKRYGEPDEKSENQWTYYRDGFRYFGVMAVVLIPIPLIIPTGKEKNVYEFEGDVVVRQTFYTDDQHGFVCGILPAGHPAIKLGCTTGDY